MQLPNEVSGQIVSAYRWDSIYFRCIHDIFHLNYTVCMYIGLAFVRNIIRASFIGQFVRAKISADR